MEPPNYPWPVGGAAWGGRITLCSPRCFTPPGLGNSMPRVGCRGFLRLFTVRLLWAGNGGTKKTGFLFVENVENTGGACAAVVAAFGERGRQGGA
jgi:hypothetical protein